MQVRRLWTCERKLKVMSNKIAYFDPFSNGRGLAQGGGVSQVARPMDFGTSAGRGVGGKGGALADSVAAYGTSVLSDVLSQVSGGSPAPKGGGHGGGVHGHRHGRGHGGGVPGAGSGSGAVPGAGSGSGGVEDSKASLEVMLGLGDQLQAAYDADKTGFVQKLSVVPGAGARLQKLADILDAAVDQLPAEFRLRLAKLSSFSRDLGCMASTGPKTPILPPVD